MARIRCASGTGDANVAPLKAEAITQAAIETSHPIAVRAVEMFCEVLGAVAGEMVLATGARGGVILGGGILPKIAKIFAESAFVDRFTQMGPMADYVRDVPVTLITNEKAALIGVVSCLYQRSGSGAPFDICQ